MILPVLFAVKMSEKRRKNVNVPINTWRHSHTIFFMNNFWRRLIVTSRRARVLGDNEDALRDRGEVAYKTNLEASCSGLNI